MKFDTKQSEGFVRLIAGQDPHMTPDDFLEGEQGTDRYAVIFGYDPVEHKKMVQISLNKGHVPWERPAPTEEDATDLGLIMGHIPVLLLLGETNAGAYTRDGLAVSMWRSPLDKYCWVVTSQPQSMGAEEGMRRPGRWISCLDGLSPKQVFAMLKL